jgi:hypothetical protein
MPAVTRDSPAGPCVTATPCTPLDLVDMHFERPGRESLRPRDGAGLA